VVLPEAAGEADESLDTGDPKRIAATGSVDDDGVVPRRPPGLSRPRGGVQDNLTRIRGVGERNEALLNTLGIFHFGQIAAWTPGEVRWIGQYLAFPERIERDDWVGQAIVLATGGDTGFEKSADRRRRRRMEERMARAAEQGTAGRLEPRSPDPAATDDQEGEGDVERWQDD
jgi:predicted flap endonuclease-1-like 5' DNA nuclease